MPSRRYACLVAVAFLLVTLDRVAIYVWGYAMTQAVRPMSYRSYRTYPTDPHALTNSPYTKFMVVGPEL
jgi:hypothetical protein